MLESRAFLTVKSYFTLSKVRPSLVQSNVRSNHLITNKINEF